MVHTLKMLRDNNNNIAAAAFNEGLEAGSFNEKGR